jgi:hypothetical protein
VPAQAAWPTTWMVDMSLAADKPSARKNVTAWQAHNRRRWAFEKDTVPLDERIPFVCECTSGDCFEVVSLTVLEYEAAHMCPNWTAVLPAHLMDDDQTRVLTQHPHFWIIELASGG